MTDRWALVVTEQEEYSFYDVGSREGAYYRLEHEHHELFATVVGGGCVCCSIASSPAVVVLARTLRMLQPMRLLVIEVGLVTEVARLIDRVRVLGGAVVGEVRAVMLARSEVLRSLIAENGRKDEEEREVMKMVGEHARGSRMAILWDQQRGEEQVQADSLPHGACMMHKVKEVCRAAGTVMLAGEECDKLLQTSSLLDVFFAAERASSLRQLSPVVL